MEDEPNLRRLVMKKSAVVKSGNPPLISSYTPYTIKSNQNLDTYNYKSGGNEKYDNVEELGPDFSKLSKELNRVVLKIQHQAEVSPDCPMHNHDTSDSRRGSRVLDTGQVKMRNKDQDYYQEHRQSLTGGDRLNPGSGSRSGLGSGSGSRMGSRETLLSNRSSMHESQYQSLPRALNKDPSSKLDRRQSFQDYKTFRDKFVGKVEFKDILRRTEEPKRPERDRTRRGRHYSEAGYLVSDRGRGRDHVSREARDGGGYLIESDFDFRSPPSTRDNSRDRKPRLDLEESIRRPNRRPQDHNHVTRRTEEVYAYPRRGQEDVYASPRRKELRIAVGETSKRSSSDLRGYASPVIRSPDSEHAQKDLISPRRVEFAGESFSFKSSETSRPASRAESPLPKSILRHTNSEPTTQRSSSHPATRSNTVELSLSPASRPTTLIIPTDGSGSFSSKHFNQINIHHRTPEKKESNPEPGQVEEPRDGSQSNSEKESCKFSINVESKQKEKTSSTKPGQPVKISLLDNQDVDSDETLTEEGPKGRRQRHDYEGEEDDHEYLGKKKRQVPPPLADWNRSQSFPPGNGELQKQSRKTSDPVALSNVSLDSEISEFYSDMDLLRSQNMSLRTRVGDLEKQVGDNVDEIKCLKGTLAECLRRIDIVETHTRHCQYNSVDGDVIEKRRPLSSAGNYSAVEQRALSRTGSYGTRA